MITIQWPCERSRVVISSTWADHMARKGYTRPYAGVDLAGIEQPLRPSQRDGKVLQSMWSNEGYGYTIFIEYGGLLRTRVAHMKNLAAKVGQMVQPNDYLGTMGSTGNSTGTHTHWEVWLKRDGTWQNIDPLNPVNNLNIVNSPNLLIPLDSTETIPMPPSYKVPEFPALVKVKPTSAVSGWINLRARPTVSSADLGDVKVGETWEAFGSYTDNLGNVWYAVKNGTSVGWAAAYFGGVQWLV